MLVGIAIDGEIEEVGANAAVVEQSIAFARRSVAADGLAFLLAADQELEQGALGAMHLLAEARIGCEVIQSDFALMGQELRHGAGLRVRRIGPAKEHPERAAVGRDLLDIEHTQAVAPRQSLDGEEREVGKVLVVDRIELIFREQPLEMGKFERDDPLRRQHMLHPGNEVIEVGNLGEDVVADDEVCPPAFRDEPPSQRQPEELANRRHVA